MLFEALFTAFLIALASLVGVLFFGNSKKLIGAQKYIVPVSVGVFISLVFIELLPETINASPFWGGVLVVMGFISFYIISHILHNKYHDHDEDCCDKKGAALLLLMGDAIHNMADGVVLGSAFLIDPVVGVTVAIGLLLHEIPQEIVEFGVLVRAGYTRKRAALLNLLSASSIILGVLFIFWFATFAVDYVWVLTALAAGNLLFLATSELLPRVHGGVNKYGGVWSSASLITLGFVAMTCLIALSHKNISTVHQHETLDDHGHVIHEDERNDIETH